jgi:hypothetical protein
MKNPTSLRTFFKQAAVEMYSLWQEGTGHRNFSLSSLKDIPDASLGGLVPALQDVSGVHARGEDFVLCRPGMGEVRLFQQGSFEEQAWARMDGHTTLREMTEDLGTACSMPVNEAWRRVRTLFLQLVSMRLCLPLNPLE